MSTFNTRKLLFAPLVAAFAISAQVSHAGESAGDTQTRVAAILQGTHSYTNVNEVRGSDASARTAADIQESTRQVLLGERNSGAPGSRNGAAANARSSIGSNGQSSSEARELTQRVVLGRIAS